MNSYILDKECDQKFLDGEVVICPFAIKESLLNTLSPESDIVIQLSNRKKYKGRIVSSRYEIKEGVATGSMRIEKK